MSIRVLIFEFGAATPPWAESTSVRLCQQASEPHAAFAARVREQLSAVCGGDTLSEVTLVAASGTEGRRQAERARLLSDLAFVCSCSGQAPALVLVADGDSEDRKRLRDLALRVNEALDADASPICLRLRAQPLGGVRRVA